MASRTDQMEQETGVPILSDQWQKQQIKAFTAWVNSHLRKRGSQIENIETDLSDGKCLMQLVEVIGDTTLPKPARGTMRIHKVQNINACFKFIKEKGVNLVSIAAEEIVDHNLKMILGMVWTLILRFEIQDISLEEMSAKDALLLWCQRKTQPYNNVDVQNFHMSWKDGLAFCALIHRHRPELLDYSKLRKDQPMENLKLAIEVADKELDIPPMIDAEDIVSCVKPDERSIMTYVAAFYKRFATYNKNEAAARKIATVLDTNRDHERLIEEYETMTSKLLEWIPIAVARLEERPALNSVAECKSKLEEFNVFRSNEFPPKLGEKGDLEAHYSTLQTKLRLSGRPPYVPSEGKMIADINRAWAGLEAADKTNKQWVLTELKRNQICEQKYHSFVNKADNHDAWTNGKEKMLATDDYSTVNLGGILALKKRHEAFQSDLMARETRVHEIGTLANELDDLGFVGAEEVNNRYATIYETWQTLVQLTEDRKNNLDQAHQLQLRLDELRLSYAKVAAPLNAFCDEAKESLSAGYICDTVEDAAALVANHQEFKNSVAEHQAEFETILRLEEEMASIGSTENPYASQTTQVLQDKWQELQRLLPERDATLTEETSKQERREALRRQWAQQADAIHAWILERANHIKTAVEGVGYDKLESQLAAIQDSEAAVAQQQTGFDELEGTTKLVNEALIFDNPHSLHTMEMLRGLWGQLQSSIKQYTTELNNQILTRDSRGITEEQMKEYRESFNHFDKDGSKKLDKLEFRGCLISLGYDIPQFPKEGEPDTEFERVLKRVDPNNDGFVTFEEFIAFMAEENADAETSSQLLDAFKVLAGDKPYITATQLQNDLAPELAAYCIQHMAPYEGGPEGALDYTSFSSALYGESEL